MSKVLSLSCWFLALPPMCMKTSFYPCYHAIWCYLYFFRHIISNINNKHHARACPPWNCIVPMAATQADSDSQRFLASHTWGLIYAPPLDRNERVSQRFQVMLWHKVSVHLHGNSIWHQQQNVRKSSFKAIAIAMFTLPNHITRQNMTMSAS